MTTSRPITLSEPFSEFSTANREHPAPSRPRTWLPSDEGIVNLLSAVLERPEREIRQSVQTLHRKTASTLSPAVIQVA